MRVVDLINNFQAALIAILTSVKRAGIPWQRPSAYDDWDSMANAIYNGLVVGPIRWALPDCDRNEFRLPVYDMMLPSYAQVSAIEVLLPEPTDGLRIFHALGTRYAPFDTVEWRCVSLDGIPLSDKLDSSPVEVAAYRVRLLGAKSKMSLIDEFEIPQP